MDALNESIDILPDMKLIEAREFGNKLLVMSANDFIWD